MCGIFLLLNNEYTFSSSFVQKQFEKGKNRGPEFSKLETLDNYVNVGFHRLAINGLDELSNQPFHIQNIMLVCNGEIYNYKSLYELMGITGETNSDCEVIVHLYLKYGIEQTLHMLDGVFSFVLYDLNIQQMFIARDPFGVRPLYSLEQQSGSIYGFASELKSLIHFKNSDKDIIQQFSPGSFQTYYYDSSCRAWYLRETKIYFNTSTLSCFNYSDPTDIYPNISRHLQNAVFKRCSTTHRPIACLLSGGLDSSLITALVVDYYKKNNISRQLETYSIGLVGSEDLKNARIVADYLQTKHTEIIVTEEEFFNSIPHVIHDIESFDTTTVRASLGNHALGKYISQHSDAKVIFNGDGSDELCGGYLYMYKAPDAIEYDKETRRLLNDIHLFDVLRSDKSISSHGLEPRTPFLDRTFVQYYLSIPPPIRFHPGNKQCEKFLLRTAFSSEHFLNCSGEKLLPDSILWRTKEAFSDGISSRGHSLYKQFDIVLEKEKQRKDIILEDLYAHLEPTTNEQSHYRTLFETSFPGSSNVVPYFWMPRFVMNATDASARTLAIYDEVLTMDLL